MTDTPIKDGLCVRGHSLQFQIPASLEPLTFRCAVCTIEDQDELTTSLRRENEELKERLVGVNHTLQFEFDRANELKETIQQKDVRFAAVVSAASALAGYVMSIRWDGTRNLKGWMDGLRDKLDRYDKVLEAQKLLDLGKKDTGGER